MGETTFDIESHYALHYEFRQGPRWLEALAFLPFFDRFAYPIALKKGIGFANPSRLNEARDEYMRSRGWNVVMESEDEAFLRGSLAFLSPPKHWLARRKVKKARMLAMSGSFSKGPYTTLHFPFIGTRWARTRFRRWRTHFMNGTLDRYRNSGY